MLLAAGTLAIACSSDTTELASSAPGDGGGATGQAGSGGTGGSTRGSGAAHTGGRAGANIGGGDGAYTMGSGGQRNVEAGIPDANPRGGTGGTGGAIIDSGFEGSTCAPNQGMCCCAGDEVREPVCSDGGWTCAEGFDPFFGNDCTSITGPCSLPPWPPDAGRDR